MEVIRPDMQQQNPENTKTVACEKCGTEFVASWYPEKRTDMGRLGSVVVSFAGWYSDLVGGICSACRAKSEAEQKERWSQERRMALDKQGAEGLEKFMGGPVPVAEFTFDRFKSETPAEEFAFRQAKKFNRLEENLYIHGPCGTGKSHLAGAVARQFFENGIEIELWQSTALLRFLRYKRTAEEEDKVIQHLANLPVLVIEDLGANKTTEFTQQMFWDIINQRMMRGQNGLVITSNLDLNELAELYTDRLPSRLKRLCTIIELSGRDRRLDPK